MGCLREHAVGFEGAVAWPQEPLHPLAPHAVVVDIAEKSHPVERAEHVLFVQPARRGVMLAKQSLDFVCV